MKKLTAIIISAALLLSTSSFANNGEEPSASMKSSGEKVSKTIETSFLKSFSSASDVNWRKAEDVTEDIYFAKFVVEQKNLFAAFTEDGELIAVSRTLDLSQLPLALTQSLKEKYSNYYLVNSVTELVFEGQTSYYITAECKTSSLELKCNANGDISVDKKTRKKVKNA